eukprot:CAMPEP_0174274992 /NCGR_PEP_ID=MMETSP0439-20130205/59585_1 /TAXON_ID=0 /ORGANISM="Stereomyxa ramosa, Strain Chinc5" /LENGTH=240 /DNA_ID=CAMNT_0015367061 /DNA_START=55 /DNA_END=777 /DNA_ORIENTATION=+
MTSAALSFVVLFFGLANCGLIPTTPGTFEERSLNGGPCVSLVEFQLNAPCAGNVEQIWAGYFSGNGSCDLVPIEAQCVAVDTHDGNCIVSVQEEEIQQLVDDNVAVYLVIDCEANVEFKGCVTRGCAGTDLSCCLQSLQYETANDFCSGECFITGCAVTGDKGHILRLGNANSDYAPLCECNCAEWNFGQYGSMGCLAQNPCSSYYSSTYTTATTFAPSTPNQPTTSAAQTTTYASNFTR